jgi:AbiTii
MSDTRNIINSIQADIIDPKADLHSILLKTKVLAYRLKNEDLKNWVKSELDGYDEKHDIPDYRFIRDSVIRGTFFNGVYKHSNRDIGITTVPEEIREGAEDIYIYQSMTALEEMAKKEQFWNPLSYEWVQLYNIHNAEQLKKGCYQLIEAYKPILGIWIAQIIGTIRSRLQDFILELDNLDWDMSANPPFDQVDKVFNLTINNHVGVTSTMSSVEGDRDNYNIGQAGAVGKFARSDGNTFIQSEQKQSLAEVAEEIQQLLKQLEQTQPTATEEDKINYVSDETTPSFKRRAIAAFIAGSETAIDEFILENKSVKVVKSAIKGWIESH